MTTRTRTKEERALATRNSNHPEGIEARNRELFREANQAIAELERHSGREVNEREFLCECGRLGCVARFQATIVDYDHARRVRNRFLVAPGHEWPDADHMLIIIGGLATGRRRAARPGPPA